MTAALIAVRDEVGAAIPIGVNVLRNDAVSAVAIACATGAAFIRVNIFVGAAITDQGLIESASRAAILSRRALGADVAIFADVYVKHAAQLGNPLQTTPEDAARDAVHRGLADAVIVTGTATGAATDPEMVARIARAASPTPVLVGSGFDRTTAARLLASGAAGAIVGTSLKADGQVSAPVDHERVRALRAAMR
jgi:hypothetical protein